MIFLELAAKRYSVRNFSPKPVEQDTLNTLLKAASLAPTAANYQPQRLLVIQEPAALAKLKDCTPYTFDAPLAILVCYDKNTCWKRKYDGASSGEVDASIVGSHLMLAATDLGLGSTWVMHFNPTALRSAYQIPDHLEPVALFPMGYPAQEAEPHKFHTTRKPLEELVTYNSF